MQLREAVRSARDSSRQGWTGFVVRSGRGWMAYGYANDTFRRVVQNDAANGGGTKRHLVRAHDTITGAERRIRLA